MSAGQQGTTQQPSQTWTEPPWSGWIETTGDALLILEAARRGLIPRVTRRLVDSERKMITSGSVFVFDEDESGIKRWTDGFFWSPSRILGNFLLYRETDKRGNRNARTADPDSDSPDGARAPEGALSRPKNETTTLGIDKHRERSLCGSLTNSYKFKSDGLMKKTFSLTIGGVAQHLISYYKIEDVENGRLRTPSSLPELASLEISPEYLDKTHFRNAPKVEIGADGIPRYRGEGDEVESPSPSSSAIVPNPIESNLPLLTDGHVAESSAKRPATKRFLPYGPPPPNRSRNKSKSQADAPGSMDASLGSPLSPSDGSTGSVALAPPPQPVQQPPHVPPVTPAYTADHSAPVPNPGAYPYSYYPPPPPINYQPPPHVGSGMYPPQTAYPPPPTNPQPAVLPPAAMPQQMPQYPYPGYAPAPSDPSPANTHPGSPVPQQPQHQQAMGGPPPPPHPHPQSYPYPYYPPPPGPHSTAHPHMQPHTGYPAYPPPPPPPPATMPWPYGGYPHPQQFPHQVPVMQSPRPSAHHPQHVQHEGSGAEDHAQPNRSD